MTHLFTIALAAFVFKNQHLSLATLAQDFSFDEDLFQERTPDQDFFILGHEQYLRDDHRFADLAGERFHLNGITRSHLILLPTGLNDGIHTAFPLKIIKGVFNYKKLDLSTVNFKLFYMDMVFGFHRNPLADALFQFLQGRLFLVQQDAGNIRVNPDDHIVPFRLPGFPFDLP